MQPSQPTLVPVVLSGGAGTRLWPVSRAAHPKPFMVLADGETLLQKTYARALKICQPCAPVTVTNRDYFFSTRDELAKTGQAADKASFLLEASGRNTAAAVAMAALHLRDTAGADTIMLVMPADHLIQKMDAFAEAVEKATELALSGKLVTFGIEPDRPETGYGYIEKAEPLLRGFAVRQFVEKPNLPTAQAYLSSGQFVWNSGMFCFKVSTLIEEMAQHAPDVMSACETCHAAMEKRAAGFGIEIPPEAYEAVPSISIDHALMERSAAVAVVPADIGWSDIGAWDAVRDLTPPEADNNRSVGDSVFVDARNTYIHGGQRMVAAVGTDDLIIVDTPDALLVANADKTQKVKEVVAELVKAGHPAYQLHQTVARPWGTYTVLSEGPRYKLKRIEVHTGASLSLQLHHHRNEHWIVVSGRAEVTNGDETFILETNESTYIPAEHKHRLSNPGTEPLVMIEVQSGGYLGEDDIVRFEDKYGRTDNGKQQ
ncbi:mannose-1-phosphate guanylyltransferase/mannose-6-phosphate isomerase [Hydrogenophaga sp. 5NK40-0174]|uniref:mannose-1-phosphate guanylyltransferase/mannose-6-phosphate isomerase n=1 Tax=Hydrogenophaga sp. 5NK40-0174 TaxID=3127649 RepID=UPI0031028054